MSDLGSGVPPTAVSHTPAPAEIPVVSVRRCENYAPAAVRDAIVAALAPLGGVRRFVRPGMRVLLKPNLLSPAPWQRAVTTHPAVVQAVAELVIEAGGTVLIGDSPGGPISVTHEVWQTTGTARAAQQAGARLVPFDGVAWRRLNGSDYFIARPVVEADLVVNLPKLKTHAFAQYTGAIKNMFGAIPGKRKREAHFRAPGSAAFAQVLVDVLELTTPALTILDGVLGQEGNGPGLAGTPRWYGCVVASVDCVALDTAVARAMGFPPGRVAHLAAAGARGLGEADIDGVRVVDQARALDFGPVVLPGPRWYYRVPSWITRPLLGALRLRPIVDPSACSGCGRCAEVCPTDAVAFGRPPAFDSERCVGCMCCAEVCPQGAIESRRNLLTRLVGIGR